jgi:hypothetical protein
MIQTVKYDLRGNILPHGIISLSAEDFYDNFVERFPESTSRKQIWKVYEEFIDSFQKEITPNFVQWIDGSFVSNKQSPNDIDFVTLIDFEVFEQNESLLTTKFRKFDNSNKALDAYFLKSYPENHSRHFVSEMDQKYWFNLFSSTKMNRLRKRFPKGFIEINFEK